MTHRFLSAFMPAVLAAGPTIAVAQARDAAPASRVSVAPADHGRVKPAPHGSLDAKPAGFALRDGDRVVFYGDSITQAGGCAQLVEAYVTTRFPGWSGISR